MVSKSKAAVKTGGYCKRFWHKIPAEESSGNPAHDSQWSQAHELKVCVCSQRGLRIQAPKPLHAHQAAFCVKQKRWLIWTYGLKEFLSKKNNLQTTVLLFVPSIENTHHITKLLRQLTELLRGAMVLEVQVSLKKHKGVILVFYFALTNCHKISGLKRHKYIILKFCMSEVCHGCHGKQIKVLTGPHSFQEALWRNLFPCLFWLPQAACSVCLMAPFLHLQSQQW